MAVSIAAQLNERTPAHHGDLSVGGVRRDLGISRERMAHLLDVSSRTIARWEDRDQLPTNRWVMQVLVQVRNLIELGRESLTDAGIIAFMSTPQPALGGRSGIEMIERGEVEMVYRELAGLAEGYTGT